MELDEFSEKFVKLELTGANADTRLGSQYSGGIETVITKIKDVNELVFNFRYIDESLISLFNSLLEKYNFGKSFVSTPLLLIWKKMQKSL